MSKISTVYTAIIDKMEALYPSKIRLHNPYELIENAAMDYVVLSLKDKELQR